MNRKSRAQFQDRNRYKLLNAQTVILTIRSFSGDRHQFLFDRNQYPKIKLHRWKVKKYKGRCEAVSTTKRTTGSQVKLSRLIANTPIEQVCVPIDGDYTNCRSLNLKNLPRVVAAGKVVRGASKTPNIFHREGRYEVHIMRNKTRFYLGVFPTLQDACIARSDWLKAREEPSSVINYQHQANWPSKGSAHPTPKRREITAQDRWVDRICDLIINS
jgi:hypothetical protein